MMNPDDSQTKRKLSVFLFKSPNAKGTEVDKYAEGLNKADIDSVTIPVLAFRFVNQSTLTSYLSSINRFSAIIFTSERAVESVTNVLKECTDIPSVTGTKSYAVGAATAEAARKHGFSPKGEMTGNAQALAEFILGEVSSSDQKPFLYPCSNLHRDSLKQILSNHDLEVAEVITYETCPNPEMTSLLKAAVTQKGVPDYAVFFSPSGFQNVLKDGDLSLFPLKDVKIIAMGPTTKKAICDYGYTVFATTDKPDLASLINVLL